MHNATDKSLQITPTVYNTGSPAPGARRPEPADGALASPARPPAIASRPVAVPPLQLRDLGKMPVVVSPDTSPVKSPTQSPVKSPSPRKVLRSISDKASAAKSRIDCAVSPRARMAKLFEGIEWNDVEPPAAPAKAPSPESSGSRKRKAEQDDGPELKKVRFDGTPHAERANDGKSGDSSGGTACSTSSTSSNPGSATGYAMQIDQLVAALGRPIGPPPRPTTPAPAELTPIKLLPAASFGTPLLRKRPLDVVPESSSSRNQPLDLPLPALPPSVSTPSGKKSASDRTPAPIELIKPALELAESLEKELQAAERKEPQANATPSSPASHDGFPFPPDQLGKLAIRRRAHDREWIGKAGGDSVAAKLQRSLDKLQADNAGRIDKEACGYLQELFGLLPAGVNHAGKTFNYLLMKSFYSLGLDHVQWKAIEQLHKNFDQLDTGNDPQGSASFKAQLGEIIAAKKGLMAVRRQTERGAGDSSS